MLYFKQKNAYLPHKNTEICCTLPEKASVPRRALIHAFYGKIILSD